MAVQPLWSTPSSNQWVVSRLEDRCTSRMVPEPPTHRKCGPVVYLQAMGFPAEKAIQKKDFMLMVNQMEKVFESMLYYCLRTIMKTTRKQLSPDLLVLPTEEWNAIRSMKAGDVGRLMIVWKKWCVMAQSIQKITNYLSYLPQMVLLLMVALPPSLSKYLRHNLLMSPLGRPDHFVAKDFWLEEQNYWLKFLHAKSGIGRKPFLASSGHAEQAADGSGGGPKLPSAATFGSFGIPSSKLP
ncbi:hypothetical protein PGTUg99_033327 [Puccinia graminis f. sp. tritici]|uniref:DUF6589 domain-containing protein n=1 Tax=Puccinia graminis f. sp. tritici TaxID=56615 RepID=A0A5B0S820_PUCGR|nr:hypothetical protein PGTUg99_033327 [Puccinia graminis f. sp. tritici]